MSMTTADVYVPVEAPPVVPHPYGLFSVAAPVSPADPSWQLGARFRSLSCNPNWGSTRDECISGIAQQPKAVNRNCAPWASFKPLTIYAGLSQSGGEGTDAAAEAEAVLAVIEEFAVEKEWWSVMAAGAVEAAAGNVVNQLAWVEQQLAVKYPGGTGVIHMGRGVATLLGSHALQTNGSRVATIAGTPVVIGGGYDTTYPTAPAIYGTGALAIRRGTTLVTEGWDRAVNDNVAIAERTYLVANDCTVVGALVTPPS